MGPQATLPIGASVGRAHGMTTDDMTGHAIARAKRPQPFSESSQIPPQKLNKLKKQLVLSDRVDRGTAGGSQIWGRWSTAWDHRGPARQSCSGSACECLHVCTHVWTRDHGFCLEKGFPFSRLFGPIRTFFWSAEHVRVRGEEGTAKWNIVKPVGKENKSIISFVSEMGVPKPKLLYAPSEPSPSWRQSAAQWRAG
ncbi:hypothetical protein BJV78DRAFT_654387 [Lactifluus subvellereus]|nr:hypothetical protein BJV78DRAFT_654387 [Lactifluus subvellereus]